MNLTRLKRRLLWVALPVTLMLALMLWARRPGPVAQRIARYHAAGLPASLAELDDWYAAVPAADNAGTALLKAEAGWRNDSLSERGTSVFPKPGQPWPDNLLALAQNELIRNASPLANLHAALALPRSRYPVDYTLGLMEPLAHLPRVRHAANCLVLEARWAAETGDPARATRALLALLKIIPTLEAEPDYASCAVRHAISRLAAASAAHVLSRGPLPEAALQSLQEAVLAAEATSHFWRAIVGERCVALQLINQPTVEMFDLQIGDSANNLGPENSALMSTWQYRAYRCFYDLSGLRRQDVTLCLERLDGLADLGLRSRSEMPARVRLLEAQAERLSWWTLQSSPKNWSALSLYGRALPRELEAVALLRGLRTSLAVECWRGRHGGALPATLAELVPACLPEVPEDPLAGNPMKYRPQSAAPGYVIYSVGKDGQDNGGVEQSAAGAGQTNGWDYTFTVNR